MKRILVAYCLLLAPVAYGQKGEAGKAKQEKYRAEDMAKLQEMMAGLTNAETRPVYKFPTSMTMRMTEYKNGTKAAPTDIKYHVNASEETFAFATQEKKNGGKEMKMVYDSKNNTIVMLDETKKTYMAMNIAAFMGMEKNMGGNSGKADIQCKKTGKTKTIQGYPCEEYVCVDKEKNTRTEVWVTNKIPVNIARAVKGSPMAGYFNGLDGMSGMMMESRYYEKDELKATIEMLDINEKANYSVALSNYKKTDMFGGR